MKKLSVRVRLLVTIVVLAVLPVAMLAVVAIGNLRDFSTRESVEANLARMNWGASYLEELIDQMDRMFYSLQINEELNDNILGLDSDDINLHFKSQQLVSETLATAYYANASKIDELAYYSSRTNKVFSVSYKVLGEIETLSNLKGYWHRLESTPTNIYFEPQNEAIYAVHSLNRFSDKQVYGGLAVKLRKEVWSDIQEILEPVGLEEFYILNDRRELIAGSDPDTDIMDDIKRFELPDTSYDAQMRKTDSRYYFIREVDDSKILLVKTVPVSQVRQGEINTIKAATFIAVIFAGAAAIISILFSLRISKPIVDLANTMRTANLDGFDVTGSQYTDELALLENGYKQMVNRLKELIQEEYQHEIELKNAQLLALQAQINPHFLNNTLNLIGGMALTKDAPEIYEMSRSISDLLRYSVTDNDDLVSLEEELLHVNNYLTIQQKRFEGRCRVVMDVATGLGAIMVPKFILQPIVENAFEYGLQSKPGEWALVIRVFRTGNRLGILVRDNGVGMAEDVLRNVRKKLKTGGIAAAKSETSPDISGANTKRKGTGIGLKNVVLRLRLRFNEESSIRVFSKPGVGTLTVLTVVGIERSSDDV